MKFAHRAGKNRGDSAISPSAPQRARYARVVNSRTTFAILSYRQGLPLANDVQQPQDVVEGLVHVQCRRQSARAPAQKRKDKLFRLRLAKIRRHRLPALLEHLEIWTLVDAPLTIRKSSSDAVRRHVRSSREACNQLLETDASLSADHLRKYH